MPSRLCPHLPLPPYSYVPGLFPHPLSDERGHSFGRAAGNPPPPDETNWRGSEPYLLAIDLFQHGYYWEAHEEWESLWHACGRRGTVATLLKGLIKLAAAGVKAREGLAAGVRRHLLRGAELLDESAGQRDAPRATQLGLHPAELAASARALAQEPEKLLDTSPDPVRIVLPLVLLPADSLGP